MQHFLRDFLNLSSFASLFVLVCFGVALFGLKLIKNKGFNLQMLFSLIIGLAFGICLQGIGGFELSANALKESEFRWIYEVHIWLKFVIGIFINLLKLLIIPLVFVGIIRVILRLKKEVAVANMLARVLFWLVLSTASASLIGVFLGISANLGAGVQATSASGNLKDIKAFSDVILALMPSNIITAMNTNNILGVVIFAFLIAFGARSVATKNEKGAEIFYNLFEFSYEIIMKIAKALVDAMPYMLMLMIADTLILNGLSTLTSALKFIVLIYIAAILVFIMHAIILMLHGLNPIIYFKKALSALLMAFSSRSSSATLPVTLTALTDKLGVSGSTASLGATLGTTMGMNGCAGYFAALTSVFVLNALKIPIGFNEIIIIVFLSVIVSVGIAGIPGITIMIISVILTGLGLEEHFALLGVILAVDPIVDMARTTSNVSGSMIASIATDKELKMLDEASYKA